MEQLDNRLTEGKVFDLVMANSDELFGSKLAYYLAHRLIDLTTYNALVERHLEYSKETRIKAS